MGRPSCRSERRPAPGRPHAHGPRMPRYRMAIRFGDVHQTYHMADVQAPTLQAALREAAALIPDEVNRTADLVEIRRSMDPEARPMGPG